MGKTSTEIKVQNFFQKLSFLFLISIIGYFVLPFFDATSELGRNLPFVNNSAVKVALVWLLCIYIAGDIKKRKGLILIFILGHILSIVSMLLYIVFADVSTSFRLFDATVSMRSFLWASILLDGLLTIAATYCYIHVKRDASHETRSLTAFKAPGFIKPLTAILSFLFLAAAVVYHIGPYLSVSRDFSVTLPMVSNSAVKVGIMGMVCFYVVRDLHRNIPVLNIAIAGHILSIVMQAAYALFCKSNASIELFGMRLSEIQVLWSAVGLDTVITALMIVGYIVYWRRQFGKHKFLHPIEFRSLMALAEVVVEDPDNQEAVNQFDIAKKLDEYVSHMTARRKWIYHLMLYALQALPGVFGKSPLSELDYDNRKTFLNNTFGVNKSFKRKGGIGFITNYMRAMIRVAQQLSYVGYYSHRDVQEEIGYKRFTERSRFQDLPIPPEKPHPLKVLTPADVTEDLIETCVCIVGSGAAGSILAHELAKKGKQVLLLERGQYVQPKDFTEDEVEMIGKLYGDGVFQQTEDFKFTILQGSCVGGTTVVNNAVCFDPPEDIIKKWNQPNGWYTRIDEQRLAESVEYVRKLINVQPQVDATEIKSLENRISNGESIDINDFPNNNKQLNPGDTLIEKGIQIIDPERKRFEYGSVDANINDCFGCGYCNIGCKYGKKLSMLDTVLPWTQEKFPGRLSILAECTVERITTMTGKVKRAEMVYARLSDKRKIRIKAQHVIVSAGAVASPYILKKSGIGKMLPVGKHLCFNVGAPVYAVFKDEIKAHDGLQISHYYKPLEHPGVIFESWWNPPVSQAINMPGWFEDHFKNMKDYNRSMAIGVLVASDSTGYIVNALTGGPGVEYNLNKCERQKLGEGIRLAGEILLRAGAEKVMYNTWNYKEYTEVSELDEIIDIVMNTDDLAVGTGHPQGGNAISSYPWKGVIGPDFRVHGYENLYVCDASVFPEALGVNPQLSVMAFAHYASSFIN